MRRRLLIIYTALLCCAGGRLGAQNLLYVDERTFHFGFSIGLNMMNFSAAESGNLLEADSARYHTGVRSLTPGLSVGLIGDLRLSRYWNLRVTPTLHFGQRTVSYKQFDKPKSAPADFTTDVVSLPISLPIYLKYSSEREGNFRPYIIGGGGVSYDLGRDKERDLLLRPFDFFVELGAGVDIYFPFFKLCPEIKYSIGFNDLLVPSADRKELVNPQEKKYTDALSRLRSQMITLTFNFE